MLKGEEFASPAALNDRSREEERENALEGMVGRTPEEEF
jgi:hypothetical protein